MGLCSFLCPLYLGALRWGRKMTVSHFLAGEHQPTPAVQAYLSVSGLPPEEDPQEKLVPNLFPEHSWVFSGHLSLL